MFQDFIEILILSAVQGISEFLPISSSAHLIIASNLYDLKSLILIVSTDSNVTSNLCYWIICCYFVTCAMKLISFRTIIKEL